MAMSLITNQTEPRFLSGTTASSHAELYVISNEQIYILHMSYTHRHAPMIRSFSETGHCTTEGLNRNAQFSINTKTKTILY